MVYRRFIKRFLDVFFAVIMFGILFIPMVIVGIIIKITSKGPVLFIQERYGRNSRPFKLYKFRSMTDQAPERSNSEFDDIKNYVTPFGMFIRKTSIDELPQLCNIIRGDMSFIGPRPLAKTDNKVLSLRKGNGADQVLPGISGLAQVNGRNNLSDEDKAKYDAKYAAYLSFRVDILLIVETFISVLKRDGVFKETLTGDVENLEESHDRKSF
ncbi:sugar transferase [Weissella paramesenteroides]|uniref:sugar transferase n=1 Tax=Weissella paramesenteroides TaxID=1249 RepID=UPI00223C349B|nr:sugar transferase [Weissella paramesenteroides]MCS9984076.1 sugar transferase [Weissella paramesenteroides]MCS9998546.1 sugar transferase [Weissella paramesenteroides]MCT0259534.1 sugar transferase [Weissella paramesenteroides]